MTIRRATVQEIPALALVARESFMAEVAPYYSEEGIRTFLEFVSPEAIAKRLAENCVAYVACEGGRFLGVAMTKASSHISMLFVAPGEQRKGIGKQLLKVALDDCHAQSVTVNSSPNAEAAYLRFGFERTSGEIGDHGLRLVPMIFKKPAPNKAPEPTPGSVTPRAS